MEILFLGTGATLPSRSRNVSSTAVILDGDVLLFDCGEGTQRQLMVSGLSFMRIEWIAISHFHGDHVLGLPGLLQSMSLSNRKRKLTFFGPVGTATFIEYLKAGGLVPSTFPITCVEMEDGSSSAIGEFTLRSVNATHRTRALSFRLDGKRRPGKFHPKKAVKLGVLPGPDFGRLQRGTDVEGQRGKVKPSDVMGPARPGPSVGYAVDTRPNGRIGRLMKGVDVLIFDSTFSSELLKRAKETGHSTALEAATVARKAGVGRLYLDHISGRYEDTGAILKEAREVFEKSFVARDFLRHRVRLRR